MKKNINREKEKRDMYIDVYKERKGVMNRYVEL